MEAVLSGVCNEDTPLSAAPLFSPPLPQPANAALFVDPLSGMALAAGCDVSRPAVYPTGGARGEGGAHCGPFEPPVGPEGAAPLPAILDMRSRSHSASIRKQEPRVGPGDSSETQGRRAGAAGSTGLEAPRGGSAMKGSEQQAADDGHTEAAPLAHKHAGDSDREPGRVAEGGVGQWWHPLKHAVMSAVDAMALRDRTLYPPLPAGSPDRQAGERNTEPSAAPDRGGGETSAGPVEEGLSEARGEEVGGAGGSWEGPHGGKGGKKGVGEGQEQALEGKGFSGGSGRGAAEAEGSLAGPSPAGEGERHAKRHKCAETPNDEKV